MDPLVEKFQSELLDSKRSVTEILRMAKIIARERELTDAVQWIEAEMNGYRDEELPSYRRITGGTIQVQSPYYGWRDVGTTSMEFPVWDRISQIENMSHEGQVYLPMSHTGPADAISGLDAVANSYPRRAAFTPLHLKRIPEAVRDRLIDWTIELRRYEIEGARIADREKDKFARPRVFEMPEFISSRGEIGAGTLLPYDFSSIHYEIKKMGIPQPERNELENLMDELADADASPEQQQNVVERAEAWILKNQEHLGKNALVMKKILRIEPDSDFTPNE